MLLCTAQLVTAALFAIFSTDNIRDLSPPLPLVTQWETWARHIRAPRTWLHHIYVYKKNTYMVQRNSWEPQLSHSHSWGQTRGRLLHTLTS